MTPHPVVFHQPSTDMVTAPGATAWGIADVLALFNLP